MGVRIDKFHLRCCLMLSSFRALNLDGDLRVPSIPVQMALAREMQNVSVIAADESKYLESASPVLRGLVIVKLFLLDLIGVPLSPLLPSSPLSSSQPTLSSYVVLTARDPCRENLSKQNG